MKVCFDEVPDEQKIPVKSEAVTLGGVPVSVETTITYKDAVTYTGGKIDVEKLLGAKTDVLETIASKFTTKKKYKPIKLLKLSYETTGKTAGEGTFYALVKFDAKKAKKAGLKKDEIKEIQALVDAVNKASENNKCTFKVVPLKLTTEGLTVKASWKKQKDGTYELKKIKSVKFKIKINGKKKTFTLMKDKDYKDLVPADPAQKTVSLSGIGNFSETVTVKTKK